jgi:hypothetical protein
MLPSIINTSGIDATKLFDHLYRFFHQDFVCNRTYLNQTIYIDPQSKQLEDGKEKTFWHLTTKKDQSTKIRLYDPRRAERLSWVKVIIENHSAPLVSYFYHQENNAKKNIRLYLWAENHDFVVILQKLGRSSSILVTSFYIDHPHKKSDYKKRLHAYRNGTNPALMNVDWF